MLYLQNFKSINATTFSKNVAQKRLLVSFQNSNVGVPGKCFSKHDSLTENKIVAINVKRLRINTIENYCR